MARSFNGSTDYLENTSLALTFQLTMACWFYIPTGSIGTALMNMGGDTNLHYHWMNASTGQEVSIASRDGGTGAIAIAGANWSYDTWHHACGVVSAQNARAAYIDGGDKGTNGASRSPTINQFNIGVRFYNATYNQYMDGIIAKAAVWDTALTDQQVANLAAGQSPLEVEYANLQGYHEILGDFSPEPDWSGNQYNLTLGGTPAQAAHVPVPLFPYKIWTPDEVAVDERLAPEIFQPKRYVPVRRLDL